MTQNFPGPYEVRIFYTVDLTPGGAVTHQQRFSLYLDSAPTVGDDFADIDVVLRSQSTDNLAAVIGLWKIELKKFIGSAVGTVDYCELWEYEQGTFNSSYVSVLSIGEAGTNASAAIPAAESIWTMRTLGGSIMKCVVLDGTGAPGLPVTYGDANQDNQDLWDFLCDPADAPFIARDGTYPTAPQRVFVGQNEHLFKSRYGR